MCTQARIKETAVVEGTLLLNILTLPGPRARRRRTEGWVAPPVQAFQNPNQACKLLKGNGTDQDIDRSHKRRFWIGAPMEESWRDRHHEYQRKEPTLT